MMGIARASQLFGQFDWPGLHQQTRMDAFPSALSEEVVSFLLKQDVLFEERKKKKTFTINLPSLMMFSFIFYPSGK